MCARLDRDRIFQSLQPRIAKAVAQLRSRRMPYGLVSVRFLLPTSNAWMRLHRDLPLAQNKKRRIFFAVANVWLTLHWLAWSAWQATRTAVKNHGAIAHAAGATTTSMQHREVLWLALLHAIPPRAYYQYQLWKAAPGDFWAYVYDNELPQFHQYCNGNMQGAGARLLADKCEFAAKAAAIGIASTPTLAHIARGCHAALSDVLHDHHEIFCKPRFGSASRGAFAARMENNALEIKLLKESKVLRGTAASDAIRKLLASDEYVIQSLLKNHDALRALCCANDDGFDEVITLRVLSHRQHNSVALFCAYLEIPQSSDEGQRYALIAVDCNTGMTQTNSDNWHYKKLQKEHPQLLAAAANIAIPHWSQIREQALRAHTLADDITVVAWDFVLTQEKAFLLEGNINWRVSAPQMLFGPLLPRLIAQ